MNRRGQAQEAEGGDLSFKGILADSDLRAEFRDFMDTRGGMESFLFYENIEIYEGIDVASYRNFMGAKLVTIFVMPEAQYWVNISHDAREVLVNKVKNNEEFGAESFERAKAEVGQLIINNFLGPFQRLKRGDQNRQSVRRMEFAIPTGGSNRIMRMLRGYVDRKERNWQMPQRERIAPTTFEPTDSYR